MDAMQEQTWQGASELSQDQRDTVRELLDSFCEKFGGTREQFAEAAGLNSGRFMSYVDGRVSDLNVEELSSFMAFASKLEKARK